MVNIDHSNENYQILIFKSLNLVYKIVDHVYKIVDLEDHINPRS